jgi:hypothetical protein
MTKRRKTAEEVKDIINGKIKEPIKAYVALEDYSTNSLENCHIERTKANRYRDWSNIIPGQSGKPSFTREDYDAFRPEALKPYKFEDIMSKCNSVYRNVGLIRNIIDLMGDFTVQGIRLVHPNKRIEQFYQNLWQLWNGTGFSERVANTLYRLSNVPIQYYTMKLTPSQLDKMYRSTASPDQFGLPRDLPPLESRELPYKYVLLDPASVVPIGGPLSSFLNKPVYGLTLPNSLKNRIVNPTSDEEREIVKKLPPDLVKAAEKNTPYILDQNRTYMLHYKKDDWKSFADPMIFAILDDIEVLMKLKLADMSALDGATSKIRIFKLGSVEHKIAPSPDMANKLSELLQNNVGAGCTDIVWGPDIDILETNTDSFNFLGDSKYEGTLNNIYAGMGIPPTLTGTFGAAGTTNNFISLKTLTERLEYGRSIITAFWNEQLKIVQSQMGFRFPAKVVFDRMVLGDEAAEKALLIQLAERNMMSDELVQHLFKADPDIERIRIKREFQERESGKRAPKAGAWYTEPQPELKLRQIVLQSGQATPSEVGLELKEKKSGEKTLIDKQLEVEKQKVKTGGPSGIVKKKPKGKPQQGRPKNSGDKQKRKARTFRARSMMEAWARDAQAKIADILTPAILSIFGKKNLRQLTTEQAGQAELIKYGVLMNITPNTEITQAGVISLIDQQISSQDTTLFNGLKEQFKAKYDREPTFDEARALQINIYTHKYKEYDSGKS